MVGYLTLDDAATYTSLSPKTLRRMAKAKQVPHFYWRLPGRKNGKLLFRKSQLDRWLRQFQDGYASDG